MEFYSVSRDEMQKMCVNAETGLNWLGYVGLGGSLRAVFATVQAAGGLGSAAFNAASAYLSSSGKEKEEKLARSWEDLRFVAHAAGNGVRAVVENSIPFPLTVLLAVWDYVGKRFSYGIEGKEAPQKLTMSMVSNNVQHLKNGFEEGYNKIVSKLS